MRATVRGWWGGSRHADRTSLVPDACELVEGVRVAMQRNNAKEVAARRPEDTAVKPPAELDRPQGDEPGGLGRHVVGLDVDVVAGLVVHRLYRGDQPGKRAGQRGELRLAGHRVRRHAERRRPERGGVGRPVARNVDKKGGKPTAMHRRTLATTSRPIRQDRTGPTPSTAAMARSTNRSMAKCRPPPILLLCVTPSGAPGPRPVE